MHAAKATLLVYDAIAESHPAVRRRFGQVLVHSGEIEKEWAHIFAREQDQRSAADYNVVLDIEPEIANEIVSDAERFVKRMADYLNSKGVEWPPSHSND